MVQNLIGGKKLILVYHTFTGGSDRVGQDKYYSPQGAIPVDRLRSHLRWLSEFAEFVTLDEILRSSKTTGWKVAVTLDDGYRNNISLAFPIFEKLKVPVTWFVSPKFVENDLLPWWDLVDFTARVAQPALTIQTRYSRYSFDLSGEQDRACFRLQCRRWFQNSDPDVARCVRHQIENSIPDDLPRNAFASRQEIVEASRSPLVSLGGHTVSHPNLARLSASDIRYEVSEGRKQLEVWTDESIRWFAYPYGEHEHWDKRTKRIVREEGFDGAVTTVRAYADQRADQFEVPRLTVPNSRSQWKTKAWILATNTCREIYRLKQSLVERTPSWCEGDT
ncbi:peptidoglycan/xylan/chitin deacetylase (PgdA/CDA1 family) [Salinibacter ruber]|uniref:Peptidoglycan/xylan/chitin deacetylase (PgdA/CDA1 family) n=1 Tax=Salinibacter ruber TaxID=146919 RepID=A0A9X2R5F6_9BACT|nr:peptidoglycan/xylan/chitin deacetylase (PgdA/CDA1 family) [Salinibacter ruber]MCS3864620.1 peptidoglycan/xylan/chitin deacetylase (PgdA/CDA1 family) [Salinibacter ruber]